MTATSDLIERRCTACGQTIMRSAKSWAKADKRGYRPVCGPQCRNVLYAHDHPRPVRIYIPGPETTAESGPPKSSHCKMPFKPQTPEEHIVASEYVATVSAGREVVPPETGDWTAEQKVRWERADAAETALWHTLIRLRALRGDA
jgi:hypothetical protein